MSKLFHVTLSQGRADSTHYEAFSKSKLLNMLTSLSEAVVRNIKEVVFSKDYNINYVKKEYVYGAVYHKVVILATSKSYAKTFTLYNVMKTVTEEKLKTEFKKLFINDEPIIDFFDIEFSENPIVTKNINNLFQVQYRRDSKTYLEEFYADDYLKVKRFVENVIGGELTEIRKFVHYDGTVKRDDNDYIKRISVFISNDSSKISTFIPKVKRKLSNQFVLDTIKDSLLLKTNKIKSEEIILTYK